MVFDTGRRIGKYTLGKKLGEGGFGVVFIAHDAELDRDVAMKFLLPEHVSSPSVVQRFLQEARAAAKIGHPGIVTVFESGQITGTQTTADGSVFIAMELLRGETLSERLVRMGRLEPAAAIEICRQVASALEAAHEVGIVHRDLKPDNIFLARDPAMPAGERIKVLDFGIAKLAPGGASSEANTHSLMVFGTPNYMSPEQCRSSARIDHRSDIYSLGCILFELVTGGPPFAGEPGELIAHHQLTPCPTARSIVAEIPPSVDAAIAAMLAKAPGARPQTMAHVASSFLHLGEVAPCAAKTMLPDAGDSRRRITPSPGAMASPPASRAIASHPTTLGSATGEAQTPPHRRRPTAMIAVGCLAVAGVALVAITAMRSRGTTDGDDAGSAPQPAATSGASQSPNAAIADAPTAALTTVDAAPPDAAATEPSNNTPTVASPTAIPTNDPVRTVRTGRPPAKAPSKTSATKGSPTTTATPVATGSTSAPDRDRDGIIDRIDACPDQAGPDNGCPRKNIPPVELGTAPVKDGLVDPFRKKQP